MPVAQRHYSITHPTPEKSASTHNLIQLRQTNTINTRENFGKNVTKSCIDETKMQKKVQNIIEGSWDLVVIEIF